MTGKVKGSRYTEPANYFPVEIRRELKIGEFAETKKAPKSAQGNGNSAAKKNTPKKAK